MTGYFDPPPAVFIAGEEDYHDAWHALGRPSDAAGGTRNSFCVEGRSHKAARFLASPWWRVAKRINKNADYQFELTDAGRAAVAAWLAAGKSLARMKENARV